MFTLLTAFISSIPFHYVPPMISSTTPDKLAEIIRDTWPNLYRPPVIPYNREKNLE
jgi:hypothetical protein